MIEQNSISIKSKNKNKILVLLFTGYFLFSIIYSFYDLFFNTVDFSNNGVFEILVRIAVLALLLYFAIYIIRRILDRSPGLLIDKNGFYDNSGLVNAGKILWSDVIEVNTSKVLLADCIMVKVKNPKEYINNQNGVFKKSWLSIENRYYSSPINISIAGLDIKSKELFRIVQEYYLNSKIEFRTDELVKKNEIIQQEKKELINSINYAKRIQNSLLPSFQKIQKLLGDCFVLYLPKDIVSGDFYWINEDDEWIYFAACDCTGHGVPGALISIVCNNALNRAVKEFNIKEPAKILDKVSSLIVESMNYDGEVKDGMDASLLAFNKLNRELFWSGANSPLWIAREGVFYELLEFKPDKQAVGNIENNKPFSNHQIPIKKGDILYLFSDGYADQFGGSNGKKLTRKKFKELIMNQRGFSLNDQYLNLLNFHKIYKGSSEQIDDILVMAIRIEK